MLTSLDVNFKSSANKYGLFALYDTVLCFCVPARRKIFNESMGVSKWKTFSSGSHFEIVCTTCCLYS